MGWLLRMLSVPLASPSGVTSSRTPLSTIALSLVLSLTILIPTLRLRRVVMTLITLLIPGRHAEAGLMHLPTRKLRLAPTVAAHRLRICVLRRCLIRLASIVAGLVGVEVRRLRGGRRLVCGPSCRIREVAVRTIALAEAGESVAQSSRERGGQATEEASAGRRGRLLVAGAEVIVASRTMAVAAVSTMAREPL